MDFMCTIIHLPSSIDECKRIFLCYDTFSLYDESKTRVTYRAGYSQNLRLRRPSVTSQIA